MPRSDRAPRAADETPWLDDRQLAAWMALGAVLLKLPPALDAQLQRDADLTHFEYLVLAMLSESPDRTLRMSQLAELASGSLSRLSHGVSRLEKRGYVRRERWPENRRITNARLTDDGWAKVVEAAPGHAATVRALVVDALDDDQVSALHTIASAILLRLGTDPYGGLPVRPPRV